MTIEIHWEKLINDVHRVSVKGPKINSCAYDMLKFHTTDGLTSYALYKHSFIKDIGYRLIINRSSLAEAKAQAEIFILKFVEKELREEIAMTEETLDSVQEAINSAARRI